MRLGVIGLGKLGLPLACVLAERGHQVVGIDSDPARVAMLRAGYAPIAEPEVQELLGAFAGRLAFSTDPASLRGCELVFVVTPTPSGPDGAFLLGLVEAAILEAAPYLTRDALLVVVSTVMPGHMRRLAGLVECGLAYNPQFIALGSVVRDLRQPDFVLIGADPGRLEDGGRLCDFYSYGEHAPIYVMDFTSAEIAKLALNCYVTMKISYANMLGEVCEALGADAQAVTGAIGLDRRIGLAYLTPGTAYGGPCFPRDNSAFIRAAQGVGAAALLPAATHATNEAQTSRLVSRILESGARRVAVLGLAYKPGTPVYEQSAGMALVAALETAGLEVRAHDPQAEPPGVALVNLLDVALDWADTVAIMVPWPDYRGLDCHGLRVFDPWRMTNG